MCATITEGFESLPSLRDQWADIFQARPHEPSTSYEWTMAMVRHHVRASDRCLLVQLHRDGRLHGLVPTVVRAVPLLGRPIVMLAPVSEEYNTHSDLLVRSADADTMEAYLGAIARLPIRWDCFRMARLLEDGEVATAMRAVLASGRLAHQARGGIAAYVLALPSSYENYLSARTAKFRNHLRRAERKLAAAGALDVHEVDSSMASLDVGFDALLQVERASWKHSHGSAISAVDHQAAFYRDVCLGAQAEGRLHLHWLAIDGRPVAYNLGYLQGNRYHYLKTSYDHAWRSLSPSTVLRARLVESLIARGVAVFDFPGEPYEWEAQWTGTVRWRQVLTIYGRTVRGRLLRLVERLRHRPQQARKVRYIDPRASRPRAGAAR